MERMNFIRDGVLRLPPGFRFHPTDEELVLGYLKPKVLSQPLPANVIPVFHVCMSDPWCLPGDSEAERYFFSRLKVKYPNGNRSNRATGSGYWKATGVDKKIVASKCQEVEGMKKTLVFYKGKAPKGCRTDWIMHEYRLVNVDSVAANAPPEEKNKIQDNWVLCRVFLKKRNAKSEEVITVPNNESKATGVVRKRPPVFYDFLGKGMCHSNLAPASSSSDSSGITEVSENEAEISENEA